jgi:hypothetical protein
MPASRVSLQARSRLFRSLSLLQIFQVPGSRRLDSVMNAITAGTFQGMNDFLVHGVDAGGNFVIDLDAALDDLIADFQQVFLVDGDGIIDEK